MAKTRLTEDEIEDLLDKDLMLRRARNEPAEEALEANYQLGLRLRSGDYDDEDVGPTLGDILGDALKQNESETWDAWRAKHERHQQRRQSVRAEEEPDLHEPKVSWWRRTLKLLAYTILAIIALAWAFYFSDWRALSIAIAVGIMCWHIFSTIGEHFDTLERRQQFMLERIHKLELTLSEIRSLLRGKNR